MKSGLTIQKAVRGNLSETHKLIRDSIVALCSIDHQDDPKNLDHWLAKRSPENLVQMIFEPDSQGFVCIEDGVIIGVSHIKMDGELTLCYVHPEHPGKGIGSLLLLEVEKQALKWGVKEITLVGTGTAKPFYEAHGYEQYLDTISYFGMPGFPMRKRIHDDL